MADSPVQYKELTLNGRLRTADDPTELISENGVIDYQTVQNMRATDRHYQAIGGTTKVNTTVLANPQIKSIFQFRKDDPVENNVLVSARDSNGLNQKVYKNGTAVPSAGDFTATALFTDSTGYGSPAFSTAPGDKLVYCNGKDTAIWGGSEMKPIGFIDMDPNGTYKYDYTEQVKNALTDSNNIATLHRRADTADANTMLLLHFDNNVTDSSTTTPHTVTNTNVTFTSTSKFGSYGAFFNGTNANLSIPDNADFDLSGGAWTIDFWIRPSVGPDYIYYQQTDANNYMVISVDASAKVNLKIVAASATVVTLTSSTALTSSLSHVAVVENANDYYIFINGQLSATTSDADRPANYTGSVYIGSDASSGNWFNSVLDEFRISNTARWTASFDPPTLAYGSGNVTTFYVGTQLPIQGVNPYVVTANTAAGSATGNLWTASGWSSLGTITGVGATPLSSVGKNTWTFSSTASSARQKSIDDKIAYWYRFDITNCDTTTTLSQVTVDTPMQTMKEMWDGQYRTCASFLVYKSNTFNDYTVNVFEDSWDSANDATYVPLDSLASATDFIVAGFTERQMAIRLHLIGGHVNTTAGTAATLSYCNGTTVPTTSTDWTTADSVDDGTINAGISFAKSGTAAWTPPAFASEFKVSISGSKGVESPSLYYYKIQFNQNLSADVQLFFVGGIPAPEDIPGHKFAVHHVDRLWLWGNEKDPLKGSCTAKDTAQVVRGLDTADIFLKNKPVAGVSLFERYGSTAANVQLVCESSRTWAIVGETVENFSPNCIDESNGCTSADTMDVATVEVLPGTFRRVGIWQAQNAIVMSDGSTVTDLSRDIRDKFDPLHENYIGAATLATCTGKIDVLHNEYVWVIPGVTCWVLDILRRKWSEKPLAATKRITCARTVYDTNGLPYFYGATNSGYLYRLDYGTSIDNIGIPFVLQLADIAPTGNIQDRTEVCSFRLVGKAKSTTSQKVLVEHFLDSDTTASVPAIPTISMANTGKRLFSVIRSFGTKPKNGILHSFRLSITTNDETIGFEPIFAVIGYRVVGKDTR